MIGRTIRLFSIIPIWPWKMAETGAFQGIAMTSCVPFRAGALVLGRRMEQYSAPLF
jgi:hypothetical protein